jgi:hypothetical protein
MEVQEFTATDEQKQLERLIALMPSGERRAQFQAQLARLNAAPSAVVEVELDRLCEQRDARLTEWNWICDRLEALDQNTPEFDMLFAEWEKVNEAYKRLDDLSYQRMARLNP